MRLIDADKLRHDLIIGHDLVGAKYTDLADTVEAIPVEWLVEVANRGLIFAHNSKNEGKIIDHGGVFHCFSGALAAQVIENLLEAWRKENGTD